jgi:hypothetical protein
MPESSHPQPGAFIRAIRAVPRGSFTLAVIVFGLQAIMPAGVKPSDLIAANDLIAPEINDLCHSASTTKERLELERKRIEELLSNEEVKSRFDSIISLYLKP